jgi:hypothetical protein
MTVSSELAVQPETDLALVPQFHAVAVNATEMKNATAGIKKWLEAKLLSIDAEIVQLQETLDAAIRHKWKSSGFKSQLQREKYKQMYYQKLLAAVHAGYTIVPSMECEMFAIRVKREKPIETAHYLDTRWEANARISDESEQRLPIGEGRYESPKQLVTNKKWDTKNDKNEIVHHHLQKAVEFADMEFPLAIAHPLVMDATAAAMALKIFDRIGVVNNRNQSRGDPIVLGQITRKDGYSTKTASFLIAWYLDPRTL